jgi:hypothetical protein
MKKVFNFLFILISVIAISCNNSSTKQLSENKSDSLNTDKNMNLKLEIIYFHATNRCPTCNAVENNAKQLLEENFKQQMNNGEISFKSLNFDEKENKSITEKYQVSFSTLLLINHQNGKETLNDFTETAFMYAKNEPEKYKALLKDEINKILKN